MLSWWHKVLIYLYIALVVSAGYWVGHLLMPRFGILVTLLTYAAVSVAWGRLLTWWLLRRHRKH